MQYFVTGTDTDVGKTRISALLLAGTGAQYWKPVQSGEPTDTQTIRSFLPDTVIHKERHLLERPLSPHAAAELEGVEICLSDFELPTQEPLIVEGAGGLMVPLNDQHLMIDLIKALGLPVILVARSGLGTLNHTLLSLQALSLREIEVEGVVMNGPLNPSNKKTIEQFGNVPVIAEVPILSKFAPLSHQFEEHFTWQWQQKRGILSHS